MAAIVKALKWILGRGELEVFRLDVDVVACVVVVATVVVVTGEREPGALRVGASGLVAAGVAVGTELVVCRAAPVGPCPVEPLRTTPLITPTVAARRATVTSSSKVFLELLLLRGVWRFPVCGSLATPG
jgi:hypothetical protein